MLIFNRIVENFVSFEISKNCLKLDFLAVFEAQRESICYVGNRVIHITKILAAQRYEQMLQCNVVSKASEGERYVRPKTPQIVNVN